MMHALLIAAVRSLVLAAVTSGSLALLRVRHPAVKKGAWAAVLAAAFAMPILGGHLLHVKDWGAGPIPETMLPAVLHPNQATHANVADWGLTTLTVVSPPTGRRSDFVYLGHLLAWIYGLVALILLLRIGLGFWAACRLWFGARPGAGLGDGSVRLSEKIRSPWTFCSGILLPASATEWTTDTLSIVLAHERSHIRQGDFYLQLAARLYSAIFWLSPLGWWLQRECVRLGEQTSDCEALLQRPDPTAYAELLLQFCSEREPLPAVTMARGSTIRSRIDLILSEGEFMRRFVSPVRAFACVLVVLPIALAIATLSVQAHVERSLMLQAGSASSTQAPIATRARTPSPNAPTLRSLDVPVPSFENVFACRSIPIEAKPP
jgi:hypothetical protein